MSEFIVNEMIDVLFINNETIYRVGEGGCVNILVSMECGQYSGVPWFEVHLDDGIVEKYNGSNVLGVRLITEKGKV